MDVGKVIIELKQRRFSQRTATGSGRATQVESRQGKYHFRLSSIAVTSLLPVTGPNAPPPG